MRISIPGSALLAALFLLGLSATGQDLSNKGKDFWVGYGYHVRYVTGNPVNGQEMVLYFATESVTNVTVSIPSTGYSQTYANIPANSIFTSQPIPKSGAGDVRLTSEGIQNKGIHITSDKPIVAYAHIYNGNVSGATLLFPTNTLGKEYYSVNFDQYSNEGASNCFFYVVAADTGTTTIEVIPSANTQNMVAGNVYTFNLSQGQVFNALGTISGTNGVDLTGSRIRSISTGAGGCKRIAVFSGSGKLNIKCPVGQSGASADNYMVQAFPKNAWGKNYLTVPTASFTNNYYRIAVSDPTTVVKLNGTILSGLIGNFYYQFNNTTPNFIEADKPVMVAQYITSASQCGNTTLGNNGDPEVIYLSPVEQNIDKVVLNSTGNFAILPTAHYINVVIPNTGTALSSFTIDGTPPTSSFVPHPQKPGYSYLIQNVGQGKHLVQSDSGFNAIAYGYGGAESYGYNAGANVKDLYQFVSIQNQYATVDFPATCRNAPFHFSMTFPYQPAQIKWLFGGLFPDVTINSPVHDSTWVVNGRQLYKYKIPAPYKVLAIGTYPIRVLAQNPTPDGCNGEQEINYDLQVFDPPVADFTISASGCVSDSVRFTDNSNLGGRPAIRWSWDFGDGSTSALKNTAHLYGAANTYTVKHSLITDIGCLSDTASHNVILNLPPVARFGISALNCLGRDIIFTDSSTTSSGALTKWYWNFGDGSAPVVVTTNAAQTHVYNSTGNFTVTLKVETAAGCQSTVFSRTIIVHPNPVSSFDFGVACLPAGSMTFINNTSINDGSVATLTYQWNFGDGNLSSQKAPVHNYSSTGPFAVKLTVVSAAGCTDDSVRTVNTIYAQPQAVFTAPAAICFGDPVSPADTSTAPASTVNQWLWNFGDGSTSSLKNPRHTYGAPGTYSITLTVISAVGCTSAVSSRTVLVNALPKSDFTVSLPRCETRAVTFSDASAANSGTIIKWSWDLGDGNTSVKTTNAPFNHTYATAGTYTVTLKTETDRGCVSTLLSRQVIISPLPQVDFIMPENCLNDPFSEFTDNTTIADGSQAAFTYTWNFGDPNATPANPNTSIAKNPRHRYTQSRTYDVQLTVTSNNGCAVSKTQQFTINGIVPKADFVVVNGANYCSDGNVVITNTSSVDFGSVSKVEIFWDDLADPTNKTTDDLPLPGKSYTKHYTEFFTPASKTYTIRLVAYSGMNCLHSTSQTITVFAKPQVAFNSIPPVCADVAAFQITGASITNGLPGSGIFSGKGVTAGGLFNPGTAGKGIHTLRYTFTSSNGCINFAEQTVEVFEVPHADAGADRFMLEGGSVVLQGSGSGNAISYLWSPAAFLNDPEIARPEASPTNDITYRLTVHSADGCSAWDEVLVKVLKAPVIPNVFTPNGDRINDRWEIKYLESYPGATVQVFNMYGQLLFESKGYSKPWDGTFKGNPVPAGTYYYIINPQNGRKQVAGYVDIVR
jgi:gliding motility-associated-like protein